MRTTAEVINSNCTKCAACIGASHICQVDARKQITDNMLMVVSDAPSLFDGKSGTVMQGMKDKLLYEVIKITGMDLSDIYFTYLVKCRPSDNARPTEVEAAACNQYLLKEIDIVRPKAIIVLGAFTTTCFGFEGSLDKLRGSLSDMTFEFGDGRKYKTKIGVTYSPYVVEQSPNKLLPFTKDLVRAYNAALGVANIINLTKHTVITTKAEIKQLVEDIKLKKECCFDYETNQLDELGTFADNFRATALSISYQQGYSYVIPLWHPESPFDDATCRAIIQYIGKHVFANPEVRKIGQNIKFDMQVSMRLGWSDFRGRLDDTMLMHHQLFGYKRHGLKEWAVDYYPQYEGYEDEIKKHGYDNAPMNVLAPYAATDTDLTLRGGTIFETLLMADPASYRMYRNLAMMAVKPLLDAEMTGMLIDRSKLLANIKRAEELLELQTAKLKSYPQVLRYEKWEGDKVVAEELARMEIKKEAAKGKNRQTWQSKIDAIKTGAKKIYNGVSIGSPLQLGNLLYSPQGFGFDMPYDRKKRGHTKATDSKFIKQLQDTTGFINDLLIWRTIQKNLSTYLQGFLTLLDGNDRIHTSFLIHGTVTGRLASRNPNLQNISKHVKVKDPAVEEVVGMIMSSFIAPEGYAIMQLDFSQAELRIIAEFANEEKMIDAYNRGMDLHAVTAAQLTGLSIEEFYKLPEKEQKSLRSKAKAANFGLIYGQQPKGFMEYARNNYGVDMSIEDATAVRDKFFDTYPALLDYHALCIARGKQYGYTRTLFGRRRFAFNMNSFDEFMRGQDERDLINHPVQGTCGEMTIHALTILHTILPKSVKFVNTVHDSIVYYVPVGMVDYVARLAKQTAENLPTKHYFKKELKRLKLVADVEVSYTNWKELKPYEFSK